MAQLHSSGEVFVQHCPSLAAQVNSHNDILRCVVLRPGYNETACPSGGRVSDTERCFPDEFNPEELPYFHRTVVLKGSAAVLFSHACML